MNKRLAIITVSAALAGGAAGMVINLPGLASAQDEGGTSTTVAPAAPNTPSPQKPTELPPSMAAAIKGLVDNGTITQAQADAVTQALLSSLPVGRGPGGHKGGGMRVGKGLDAAATALGMTEAELRTALQGGKTIADVAKDKGVDVQKVIDAMVAEAKTHLDQAVTNGKLTQAQADQRLTTITDSITKLVNGQLPAGGPGFPGHHDNDGDDNPPSGGTTDTTTATG